MKLLPKGGPIRTVLDLSLVGCGLTLAIPTCCAMFPQMAEIKLADLEPDVQEKMKERKLSYLVFNKGL